MNEVTRILSAIEQGDRKAADELLPLVYGELRRLAKQRLAHEEPGQTLEPTALVHEAYLRLVNNDAVQGWGAGSRQSPVDVPAIFADSAAEPGCRRCAAVGHETNRASGRD